ncbi:hypothetical protein [Natrinema sp. J7-1]|uniref:hypothetical protein n=1 Tax=Natrinema sp. J7-1 TaxID=1172566 RepID=UPI0012DF0D85|nr:hypothetical protein [Natrinema sp. J7-1]
MASRENAVVFRRAGVHRLEAGAAALLAQHSPVSLAARRQERSGLAFGTGWWGIARRRGRRGRHG